MEPIKNLQEILENWDVFENEEFPLYAFLLYEENCSIATYTRKNLIKLDEMSGKNFLFFLIEKPPEDWQKRVSDRQYSKIIQFRENIRHGYNEIQPYDKTNVLDVEEHFSLLPNQIPCMVFFKSIKEKDMLVLRLDTSWDEKTFLKTFTDLFSEFIQLERKLRITRTSSFSYMSKKEKKDTQDKYWNTLRNYVIKKKGLFTANVIYSHPVSKEILEILEDIIVKTFSNMIIPTDTVDH